MPKFLFTIIAAVLASLTALIYMLIYKSPEETVNVAVFLSVLWIFITLALSLLIYAVKYKRASKHTNLRTLYRSAARPSVFTATLATGFLVIKVLGALTIINAILFVVFIFSIYKLTSKP
ncbi:hypothetical protein A2716_02600 [candidate division WWE3 bacterium RIFCSPHIGHO2_01_FULL_40_23]|uniref:Uncharacterized protein n=1 Tax=candidate division WWE3 bacterium RIFCSPLOWO2_01_FULL_41_18 TaxID=1802625 RepID=A0A1F4VFI3_UNCKA|nr:MAG: hypothetical protein A2716_02600 [candidate division WWE3 bacterium RIFCSPHIGHO2_01_FULL_40_23]OGC55875.1 MAG: hypothetical protein A3A78_02450 [candidate division WWE3 bacterium RIFCSPLOWO2_01_FULL_41_18]